MDNEEKKRKLETYFKWGLGLIGAAGGGVFTAGLLTGQGQIGFITVPFQHGDEVITALNNGEIAAAIFVGASPLPNIIKLNQSNPGMYKLLPIDANIASNLAGVYKVAKINYVGMNTTPISTLAPWATILSRHFATMEKNNTLKHFRDCFYKQLPSLQDNFQPIWQQVDASDRGVIDYLELN